MADDQLLTNIEEALKSLPFDMLRFAMCLRSLYVEKNVGNSSEAAVLFQELRDETRKDAILYCKGVLPFSKKLVSAVDGFFDYYIVLDFNTWTQFLPDILDETQSYRGLCQTTVKMHEDLMKALKPREDKAKEIMLHFAELQQEYDEKVKELDLSAARKKGWAIGLAFIPIINMFASPILGALSSGDQVKSLAFSKQAELQEAAALIVKEELIPALRRIIEGMTTVAGFLSVMEIQLQQLVDRGVSSGDDRSKHYNMIRNKAKEIKSNCAVFMTKLPAVRTNIETLPTEGVDRNYIQKWVKSNLDRIKKERNARIRKTFLEVLKGLASLLA